MLGTMSTNADGQGWYNLDQDLRYQEHSNHFSVPKSRGIPFIGGMVAAFKQIPIRTLFTITPLQTFMRSFFLQMLPLNTSLTMSLPSKPLKKCQYPKRYTAESVAAVKEAESHSLTDSNLSRAQQDTIDQAIAKLQEAVSKPNLHQKLKRRRRETRS